MKKLSVLGSVILAFCFGLQSFAIDVNIPLSNEKTSCKIANSRQSSMQINFHFGDISAVDVKTKQGVFTELHMQNAYTTERIGAPALPAQKRLIAIPFGAEVSAKVVNISDVKTIKLADFGIKNQVMPKQYDAPKNVKKEDIRFEYNAEAYTSTRFNESEMVKVEVLGTFRGLRIARVTVEPMRYNPSTRELQVYSDIDVEINYTNADYAKTDKIFRATYSPFYNAPYNAFLNIDNVYDEHPDLMTPNVKMLIVSHPMFENTLAPFIEWKTKMGYEVIVAYTDDIGDTPSSIQTWVHEQYNTGVTEGNAPDFVIFVGDTPQVPASKTGTYSGKKTDLYYVSVDGDQFPEMYYSRLSATTTEQLQNQLDKILYYEQYQIEDPSYLNDVTLIAGADPSWNPIAGQPTIKYGTQNYFNTTNGYTTVNEYLDSYIGCYDPERIAVGFINYTAHCAELVWADPELTQNDVNNFTNANKYPVAIGNCCLAANFGSTDDPECIAETWMRAKDKGAVGYIGSSPSSYWHNDVYWSVGAYDWQSNGAVPPVEETSLGAYDAPWNDTYNICLSSLHFVGNLAVTEAHDLGYQFDQSTLYYWEAYCTFGDPSLMPFHTQPTANDVSHMEIFPIGMDTYEITAEPNSWVGISKDGVLVGSGFVNETGTINVPVTPVTNSGNVDIVVSKPQRQPYIASIPAAALEGPYIVVSEYSFENGEISADYNTTQAVNVTVKNVGADNANDVNITFTTEDEYCSIEGNNTLNVGSLTAGTAQEFTAVINVKIANDVPDMHRFEILANISGNDKDSHEWQSKLNLTALAPVVNFTEEFSIDDASGNGNGRLDAGETATVSISLENIGHARAHTGNTTVSSASEYLGITNTQVSTPAMDPSGTTTISFEVNADAGTPIGTIALTNLDYTSHQYTANTMLPLAIGEIIEDFETGDFTAFDYSFNPKPWIISNDVVFEGEHAMRSAENLGNSSASTVEMTYNGAAAGQISFYYRVSSEQGYDKLHFYIDGEEQDNWSGNINWTEASFDVTAGDHVFKWEYKKDFGTTVGEDCAWVDFIKLPAATDSDALIANFTAVDNTIEPGESVEFQSASTGTATSWTWTFEGGNPATSTEENPVVEYANIGLYNVTLEVSDGSNTSTITKEHFVVVSQFEGLQEMTNATVNLYPNPNNGTFYVDIQGVEDANIYIYNATGKLVYQEQPTMDNSIKQINLNNASEGVYFMVIANKTQKVMKKIVIK